MRTRIYEGSVNSAWLYAENRMDKGLESRNIYGKIIKLHTHTHVHEAMNRPKSMYWYMHRLYALRLYRLMELDLWSSTPLPPTPSIVHIMPMEQPAPQPSPPVQWTRTTNVRSVYIGKRLASEVDAYTARHRMTWSSMVKVALRVLMDESKDFESMDTVRDRVGVDG